MNTDNGSVPSERDLSIGVAGPATIAGAPTKDHGEDTDSVCRTRSGKTFRRPSQDAGNAKESAGRAPTAGTDTREFGFLKDFQVRMTRLSESELSDASFRTVSSVQASETCRLWRKEVPGSEPDLSSSDSDTDRNAVESSPIAPQKGAAHKEKRERGRPPTTGDYVGLAKAKRDYLAACEAEDERIAEQELAAEARTVRRMKETYRSQKPVLDTSVHTTEALGKVIDGSLNTIDDWTRRSKNLKGTVVKSVREAVDTIREVVRDILTRPDSEEMAAMKASNAEMERQMAATKAANAEMEKQMAGMRREIDELRRRPAPEATPSVAVITQEVVRQAMAAIGPMIGSRSATTEGQLSLEPRPARSVERRRRKTPVEEIVAEVNAAPSSLPTEADGSRNLQVPSDNASVSAPLGGKKKKKKKTKKSLAAREAAAQSASPPAPVPSTSQTDPSVPLSGWSTVVARGAKKANSKAPVAAKKAPKPRIRPPRTEAVTLTLKPGAEEAGTTYESVLSEARDKIDLQALGIDWLKFRKAATGGRLFEIAGVDGGQKADALAAKLREVLSPEVVNVLRPTKRTEIRISGMDDSIKSEEVAAAIARLGNCSEENVRVGKTGPSRAIIVSCPTAVAKTVVSAGKIGIGWIMARVEALEPRPVRCYRCLEVGHLAAKCRSDVVGSGRCFRCGETGHVARQCSGKFNCALCVAAGKPADHRIGEKGCASGGGGGPKKKNRPKQAERVANEKGDKSVLRQAPQERKSTDDPN